MIPKKIYRIGSIFIVLLALAAHQSLLLAGGRMATSLRAMLQPNALPRALQDLRDTHAAELIVQRSWLLAQQAGAYDFRTELEQTTYHAPALTNVGRPAQVESIYLEGAMDTNAKAFQLAIWQGSSVLQRDQAYEVRAEGDHTYGRTAGGPWEEIEDVTTLFAPNRDTLAYLHGIKNVRDVSLAADNYRHFSFDMDGPAFAEYMRRQLEDELRRAGKLPAGITLDTPQVYHGVIGAGELWLTSAGLPEQLNVTLNFPQQADGQRVRAVIRTDFANFDTDRLAHSDTLLAAVLHNSPLWLANQFSRMALINLADVGGALGLLMVLALGALWVVWFGRKPSVQIALNVVLIGAIVLTPLLQSARVRAFSLEQAAGQQEVAATQTQSDGQRAGNDSVWNPKVAPLAVAEAKADATLALAAARNPLALSPQRAINAPVAQAAANQSTGDSDGDGVSDANEPPACIGQSDCDGDGLTDLQELRLGTRLNDADSDGDNLRDDLEVKGFEIGGRRWYANPNNGDTNGDGIPDTLECWNENTALDFSAPVNVACNRDTDGNGVPDLFTYDNDGDGVDDTTDLSPFQREATIFDATTPFTLQSNGLTPNEPLFIDFQMVPTTADQISYARNVLDWPNNDTRGQLIRTNDTTFSTYMAQGSYATREGNGDMRLVPLVEIKMPATDAYKILPVTDVLTVTRSAKAYETITTGSGDKQKSAEQIWLQAQLAFRGDHGNTTVFFSALTDQANAPLTVDTVQIVQSTCAAKDSAQPVVQTTSVTQPWVLDQIALPDLMDGHHAIVFEKGSGDALRTLCMPLGDVANGTLTGGKLFDQKQLDAYGITLRDIVDQTGRATHVIAYLPANVVTGQTGGEKQAFGARMLYWPATGVTSLGAAQEVRLVWMVQLLDDRGDTQIVHAYRNESWRLAGLRARQDIAMRSAVIYQEPDAAANGDEATKSLHARLWNAIVGLDAAFAHSGADRLPLDAQLVGHLVEQGYVPQDALGSAVTSYETQDEIARVASEVTPGILGRFITDGKYKTGYDHALLIFAREEEYKTARWAGGNMLTLPTATDTLASYSWKPFRYTNGVWESFPAKEYLDLLQVRLHDVLAADQALAADPLFAQAASAAERVTLRAGIAFANQMFALGMLFGADRIVARNNTPVAVVAQPNLLAATLKSGVGTAGAALKFIAKEMVVDLAQNVITNRATVQTVENFAFASEEVLSAVRSAQAERTNLTILGEVAQGRIAQRITTLQELTLNHKLLGAVAVAAPVAALALILGTMASENPTVGGAVDLAMPVINSAFAILGAVSAVNNALTKVGEAGGLAKAMDAAAPLSRAAKIGIVVGLVLSVGIAVGVFIAQWVAGAFSITDLGFTAALSAVIATIIVAALLLAISLIPIVGPIIVAVLGLIDTLIAGVCAISKAYGLDLNEKATLQIPRTGAKLSFCAGITGLLTEGVRFLLFSQTVLVGNMTDSDRLTTSNFSVNLTNPEQGFQVGNSIKPALRIDNKIKLVAQPFDWKSAVYFWQLNWDNLDNTTHRYDLTTDKTNRDVSTGEMESEWQEFKDGRLTGSHASPGIQYEDPLVMEPAQATIQNTVPFTRAGINVPMTLYLREAYANPAQECWAVPVPIPLPPGLAPIPVCVVRSDQGTNHIDLQLRHDIFPATLNEFYAAASVEDGASLAWGQEGAITFPVQRDFDGDGLLSAAVGGNDTDDRYWDADHDGLSDLFEAQKGTRPDLADSDQDGLDDRIELLVGSDPLQPDSDGDGLLDGEEIFHADTTDFDSDGDTTEWVGGWTFVYDLVDGQPQRTWVTSDPLVWNSDGDTFSDYQERLYGLNPRVFSDPTILKLNSRIEHASAPSTLLRFAERAGATVFVDSSGHLNNAVCKGDACPQAGHEGRYTNGLVFDGKDDLIVAAEATPLANSSFTVALWARPAQLDQPGVVFSSRDNDTNAQLWLRYAATNQFLCGFTADSFLQSEVLTDTDWHHWACTYELQTSPNGDQRDTVSAKLYRDGEVVDEQRFDWIYGYHGSGDWWIGGGYGDSGTPSHFSGTLDELVVAPAALNEREINLLMAGRYHTNERQFLAAPGDTLTYQATLENNLLGRTLSGLFALDAPTGWESTNSLSSIQLAPAEKEVLAGTLAVAETTGSGTYSLTLTAGAAASASIASLTSAATAAETEPAVHYTFDDKSLSFAPASQAIQKAGSLNFAAGIGSGNALALDGRSVFEVNNNAFDMSNTPFTYALWVKPDAGANGTRAILGQPPSRREWEYNAGGIYLEIQDGKSLLFGWGDEWTTDSIADVFTPNAWTHILITYDQQKLTVYVNGVEREQFTTNGKPPISRPLLSIGDENYCGEFALGQVHTLEADDGPGSAEYGYVFVDENGTETFLLYDDDADSDEWEPSSDTYFNDKYQTFCLTGARVYAYEDDGGDEHKFDSDDDGMYPDVRFDFTTPEQEGLKSPEISGDGRIEFYYDISNPVLPFKGSIDDLRLYRRALNEGEAQQLYESASVPYHYALDEPPGADLADTLASDFNFANQGAIADPRAQGTCDTSCPTSGVPGRVNRALLFRKDAGEGIRIHQLTLPQAAPGFSLWVKPETLGVFFGLNTEANGSVASLFYDAENHFCLAQAAQSVCSTTAYPVGQWVHTMLTFANQELILHLNNSERVTLPTGGAAWPGAGVYSIHLGGTNFGGMLDDLRIPYDGSDVTAMYQSAPIVSLHFDETTSATIAFDNGGGVNVPCAGSTCPATQRRGKVDRAVAFDGIDDGLIMPASDALNLDHFTLATWVNPAASANADALYPLIAKNAGDERNYALYLTEELTVVATRNCAAAGELLQVTSKEPIPLNEYTHIAATYDGSYLALYINGVLNNWLAQPSSSPCYNDSPLTIGVPNSGDSTFYRPFNGLLDELLIYSDALWDYQIQELYAAQANWIVERQSLAVTVDADPPSSSLAETLPAAINYYANQDVQLGVYTSDAGSEVSLLELGVNFNGGTPSWYAAQPCQDAARGDSTAPAWCPWFLPSQWGGEGRYELHTRATDAVGHRETPTALYSIVVDDSGPALTIRQEDGSLQNLVADTQEATAQLLLLDGTASDPAIGDDPGSGLQHIWVTLRDRAGALVGDAPYAATITGNLWSLAYPFYQAQVSGFYTLEVWADDALGNETRLPARTLALDGAAPSMTIDEVASGLPTDKESFQFLNTTTLLQGQLDDRPTAFSYNAVEENAVEENAVEENAVEENAVEENVPVAGVQYGAASFTPLWAVEDGGMRSPHLSPQLADQVLYLPLDDLSHPISDTTTIYRNLADATAENASCDSSHCPQTGSRSPVGPAVAFDGQDDYITLPAELLEGDDFTFASWLYLRAGQSAESYRYLFGFGPADQNRLELMVVNRRLLLAVTGGGFTHTLSATDLLPAEQWVHVAVTVAGGTGRIYIDGVEKGVTNDLPGLSQIVGKSNLLGTTAPAGYAGHFLGLMSDVRIFSRALSAPDIKALQLGNRALLALPLDEGVAVDGSTLTDKSGWPWHATLHTGATDAANKSVAGHQGNRALEFDGIDDYVSLPAEMWNRYTGSNAGFTFATWLYWRGNQANGADATYSQSIFSFSEDAGNTTDLSLSPQDITVRVSTASATSGSGNQDGLGTPLLTNQWVHVALTIEPDPAAAESASIFGVTDNYIGRIYINGEEQMHFATTTVPTMVTSMTKNFLGRPQEPSDASQYFNGLMDDVRIYPRPLSPAEIVDLNNAGWRMVTLGDNDSWSLNVPGGLQGVYRVDLLAGDLGGHSGYNPSQPALNHTIDSVPPVVDATVETSAQTGADVYLFHATDPYLSERGLATACGANGQIDRVYRWDNHVQGQKQLTELTVSCLLAEATAGQLAAACDLASNCATVETALSTAPQQSAKQTVQPIQDELSFLRHDTLPAPAVQPVASFAQPMLVSYHPPYASSLRQDAPTAADLNRGLVLHWALEEGPGNCTVQDQSGNALNGSFANLDCTTAWSTDVPPNRGHAYSLYLDGNADANAHLRSINSELLPAANSPRTLCAWAKSTDGSVNGWAEHVVNYGAATAENQAFGIMMYTGNTWYAYRHISDLNTQVVADTEWHQHCLVHDGATLSYYLDGQLAVAADATLDTAANTPFVVGVRPDLESHTVFDGWVDDLRLYNRALTAAEVQSLATLVASSATPAGQDATPGTADATAPTVLFAGDVLTTNAYSTVSGLIFRGDVSSETGIVSATATLDLGNGPIALSSQLNPTDAPLGYAGGHAFYAAAPWTATWRPDAADAPPDATNGTLTLTIYDASLTPTTVQQSVTLDLQTPNPGQLTILANGAPMVANRTYTSTQLSTAVLIPPIADAGGVTLWYGWTDYLTATLPLLTQASDPAAGLQLDQDFPLSAADGPRRYYFHIIARDGYGNSSQQRYGPYTHDLPGMPDQIDIPEQHGGALRRAWTGNRCTLLGTDQRIAAAVAPPERAQSLYLTRSDTLLHLLWEGADWSTDGDLFVYLDTIPGQGSLGAFNPYTSTAQSTVLLLPTRQERAPGEVKGERKGELNAMGADYALWVADNEMSYLLRWDGATWVNDGPLTSLGGAYTFSQEPEGRYTDLVLPFSLIGNPTGSMDLVAFAVDADEGPSRGLRLWSVLPYANPVDSARVVADARGPDQPHRMTLTDRYPVSLAAGTCLSPEVNVEFSLSSDHDGIAYDAMQRIQSDLAVNAARWEALYTPYDDQYQSWLAAEYCPTDPTFPGCSTNPKELATVNRADFLITNGMADGDLPPLLPGDVVTYTLHYLNPATEPVTLPAYLYTDGDLNKPQSGMSFQNLAWVDQCPGWLTLDLQPGTGTIVLVGTVQAGGVQTVTLDIDPTYGRDGCALAGMVDGPPVHRLQIEHAADDGAPGYIAIAPNFTIGGPMGATVQGVVQDRSPVPLIELEVNGGAIVACEDATPTDGEWACAWDIVATNGGSVPENGAIFTLRARATDIFGQQSDWSAPREVIIDAAAPLVGPVRVSATAEQSDGAAPTLVTDSALDWSGVVTDSVAVASVVVCDNQGENCSAASLTPAAVDEPPAVYGYTDQLDEPLPLNDSAVCTTGVGVVRSFAVGDSFTIAELAVGLRLTHSYRSDLFATLTAPSGTQVVLFDFDHNVAAANVNALFSDMGAKRLADERADHPLDGAYADNIYRPQEKLAAFAGADAAGTWTLTICDRDAATDTGTVDDAALYFTAVAPWRSTRSNWSYSEDVSNSDGVVYTRQILATDEYGQSSSVPVEISAVVDNVPPVLTVTQVVTKVVANTNQQIFRGAVSDGTAVESIGVVVTEPTGRTTTEMITGTIDSWNYALTPAFGGEYRLTVYATDRAGNLAFSDPFSVLALWPLQVTQRVTPEENVAAGALVTYTIEVENPNGVETAQNVSLSMQLSEWLTPVETADAIVSATTLSWPAVALEAGAIFTKTVLARLTDNLMITSTITGTQPITLPVTEWVNLQGTIMPSQAFATTDNLGVSESYQSNFSIEDAPQLSNEVTDEVTNEVAPPTETTAPPVPAQEALTEIGQLLITRQGAEGALTSVIWSPDAQYFAAGSMDGTIGVWQLDTAEPVYRLGDQGAAITRMVWSSSPQYFASGSADGLIYLWDLETGEPLLTFEGDGSPITSMLWPADSSSLLYGTADGNVGIVIPENQQSPILVEGHAGVVTSLALSLDNTYLAVGTESGVVLLYNDLGTGNALPFEGHTGAITNLSWSSADDALTLLSSAADGTVRQWDVATGAGTVVFDQLGGNSEIAIAPDRRYLALIADDGRVLLWDDLANDTPHPLARQEGAATQVAWSPDGTLLVVGFADGRLQVWQLAAAEE